MFTSDSYEVHKLLSEILDDPSIKSQDLVYKAFPDKDNSDKIQILTNSQKIITKTIKIKSHSGLPKPIHGLRFCWTVLRLADNALRKTKTQDFPANISYDYLIELFKDEFPFPLIHSCLLEKILEKLRVESDGMYIKQYASFLKPSTKSHSLDIHFFDQEGQPNRENLNRLIYWIVRKNRYQYVEEDKENGKINIRLLAFTDLVKNELKKWCRESDLSNYSDLTVDIEDQINLWLQYSCLDGDSFTKKPISKQIEIAKSFIKENNLKSKMIEVVSQDPQESKKILELEAELAGYIEEIRKLEKENEELRKTEATPNKKEEMVINTNSSKSSNENIDRDFLEYLRIIDSKYSFDDLRSIQLGDNRSVTMKNFIAHFFYGLRKKGLVNYPTETEFQLSYEKSGLYNCVGFEVSPGDVEHVEAEKRGWAIKKGESLYPVRKAVVKLKSETI